MALAATGTVALTLGHPSSTRQFTWPWFGLLLTVWLAPLVAVALAAATRKNWRRPDGFCLTGLLLLAGGTLVSAVASPHAAASLPRVWPTLAGVAALLWLHDWLGDEEHAAARLRRLAGGLAVTGALLVGVSLTGWLVRTGGTAWSARNDFPFGHSIQVAGAMLLLLPWLLAAAWSASRVRRTGWLVTAGTGALVLLLTSSRSAVLVAVLVAGTGCAWVVFRADWSRRAKTLLVLTVLVTLAGAVLANPRLRELALHGTWGDIARESNTQRAAMFEAGLVLGADRPLTGWGPGTVPLVYPQIRHRLSGGVDNVLQLHNTPAQVWAALGIPGGLALVLLLCAGARRLVQLCRETTPGVTSLAAAASVASYALFALTDHQLDLPALNALLVLNAAILLQTGPTAPARPWPRAHRLGVIAGVALVLVPPLGPTLRDLAARYRYDQALTVLANGRTADALAWLEAAAQLAPHDPYYRHQAAGLLLTERSASGDADVRAALGDRAAAQLEASLAAGTFTEFARFNLGWLALERADHAATAGHFHATLHEAPHRRGAWFGLGLALRSLDRETDAVRAFALEWLNDPATATAPLWEWPDFAPLRPAVEAEALRLLTELEPAHPAASYLSDLWRWWWQGAPPPRNGYNPETGAFVRVLTAGGMPDTLTAAYPWSRLLQAWRSTDPTAAFAALTPRQPGLAAALTRRAARHPVPDVRGFLTAGLENEAPLLGNERAARTGYGVLALHPDGPVLVDLFVRQQHRLVSEFASTLFPPKGWLPAADLLARLPSVP